MSRLKPLIAVFITSITLAPVCISCGSGRNAVTVKIPSLEYVGKLCNLDSARTIELTQDGFILAHSPEEPGASPIYVYTTDGDYIGTFKSNDVERLADTVYVDENNLVTIINNTEGTRSRYKTDGTPFDAMPLNANLLETLHTDSGIAQRPDGTLLFTSIGIVTNDEMAVTVLGNDLSVITSIRRSELVKLLSSTSGIPVTNDAFIQGIASGVQGECLLLVNFNGGKYDTRDGILVLNQDLSANRYIGASGQFNALEDVCVDANGYHYVADTWNRRISAYDEDWNLIAVSARDGKGKALVVNPHCIRIRGDDIYVVAYGKERTFETATLQHFKTVKP
jgi:hypothetical protein